MRRFALCAAAALLLCGCDDDPRCFPVSRSGPVKTCVDKLSIDRRSRSIDMIVENQEDRTKMISTVEVDCDKNRMRPVKISISSPNAGSAYVSGKELEQQRRWIPGSYDSAVSIVIQHYCSAK